MTQAPLNDQSRTGIDPATIRGIFAMVIALFGFVVNDAFVKFLADEMPLGQIIFMRGCFATCGIAVLISVRREWPGPADYVDKSVLLRNIGEVGGTVFYLTALTQLPLANAVAILQAMPFVITAAAAILLRESVGWRRWTAILVGFFGVLLIVRPGTEGFNTYTVLAVIAVGFITLRDMATRYVPKTIATLAITFSTTLAVTAMSLVMGLFEDWSLPELDHILMTAAAALFLMLGYIFAIVAMREGEISVIAPFRYTIVVWALIIDFLVWSKTPTFLTVVGIAIIVASGLYIFFRERRVLGSVRPGMVGRH